MAGSGTRKRWRLAAVGSAGQGEREEENRKAAGSTHGGQRRRLGGWPEKAAMGARHAREGDGRLIWCREVQGHDAVVAGMHGAWGWVAAHSASGRWARKRGRKP